MLFVTTTPYPPKVNIMYLFFQTLVSPVAQMAVIPSHYHDIISLRSIRVPHNPVLRLCVPIPESMKRQIGNRVVHRSDTIGERRLF